MMMAHAVHERNMDRISIYSAIHGVNNIMYDAWHGKCREEPVHPPLLLCKDWA